MVDASLIAKQSYVPKKECCDVVLFHRNSSKDDVYGHSYKILVYRCEDLARRTVSLLELKLLCRKYASRRLLTLIDGLTTENENVLTDFLTKIDAMVATITRRCMQLHPLSTVKISRVSDQPK